MDKENRTKIIATTNYTNDSELLNLTTTNYTNDSEL